MAQELNYGDLILVCGDIYTQLRVLKVPEKIVNMFGPNKVQHVICTGNVGNRMTYDWLKGLSPNLTCVKGQYDEDPEIQFDNKTIKVGQWKFYITHGHSVVPWGDEETLSVHLKENDADIAIFGNSHESRISKLDRKYFITPGTMSGAYGACKQYDIYYHRDGNLTAEFIILEMLGNEIAAFRYKVTDKDVQIEKATISK